jgi:peptidyl-tRNA hydrolase
MKISILCLLLCALDSAHATSPFYCETELLNDIAIAVRPSKILSDGRIEVSVDYTYATASHRTLQIPSFVRTLKNTADLKIIVLSGNSGNDYEHTRHSLAFLFGSFLMKQNAVVSYTQANPFFSLEDVEVSYDDQTRRSWRTTFVTETPFFRTNSGEVFYFPHLPSPVLMIKMIGDYNEIGDFAAPIIQYLKVPADHVLLVHDDLNLREQQFQLRADGPAKFGGNNSVFSMIRSLSYQILDDLLPNLQDEAREPISTEKWSSFIESFRSRADIRDSSYLGQPTQFSSAFKNAGAIETPIVQFIKTEMIEPLKLALRAQKAILQASKRGLGEIAKKLADKNLTLEDRAQLNTEKNEILARNQPQVDIINKAEREIDEFSLHLRKLVQEKIEARISFAELIIGIDNETRESNAAFVLGPFPPEIFNDDLWAQMQSHVMEWLKR